MNKVKKVNQSEKILNAAYKCLASKGYAEVSLREIADEAGVALSQLHYYFGNKKELFRAVIKKMIKKYLQEVEYHLKKEETATERTSSLIKFFQELLRHNSELFCLLYDFTDLALWSDSFRELLTSLFKDLSNMIEEFILNNSSLKENLRGYTSKSLARMILGAMYGIAIQVLLDPNDEVTVDALNAIQIIFE